MILFDQADGQGAVAVEVLDAANAEATAAADPAHEQATRDEVEEWLDAVALCFNLREARRWIDP